MKEYVISKLKKEYQLYLRQYLVVKQQVNIKEEDVFYSKLFITPYQTFPANTYVKVPLQLMQVFSKRYLTLKYKITSIDHQQRKIYADLVGMYLEGILNQNYNFGFNQSLKFKKDGVLLNLKLLFFKKVASKVCSKKKRTEVKKQVLQYLNANQGDLYTLLTKLLNKNFNREIMMNIKNSDFLKAILMTDIEKID